MADWSGPVGWLTEKLTRPKKKTEPPRLKETIKKATGNGWVNTKDIMKKRKQEQERLLRENR